MFKKIKKNSDAVDLTNLKVTTKKPSCYQMFKKAFLPDATDFDSYDKICKILLQFFLYFDLWS